MLIIIFIDGLQTDFWKTIFSESLLLSDENSFV